ncbi:MAG: histidine--tRNA ligase [Bacilli bacterium]
MYQKVKGTLDFYDESAIKYRYLESVISKVIKNYGYTEVITPIFENTEIFVRTSGEESDIVTKEMYTFLDKGKRSITLRPEGTAGVVRSFLENKMYANTTLTKLYYFGPMFRYERPQTGRYRQFTQFGVEAFGASSPLLDADVIISAYQIFKSLGIDNLKLKINTIGDFTSRNNYVDVLQDYFRKDIDKLCSDCNNRLEKNPLRILDCKIDSDNPIIKSAPKISDSLTQEAKDYFKEVLKALDYNNINYFVDENLVRGLDYYTDTVFEFIIESDDNLNGLAICGGGKYSDMVKSFGGPDIPGIGYAFGIERVISIMDQKGLFPNLDKAADVVLIALDEESKLYSLNLANKLRMNGYYADIDYFNTTMKQQFKLSDRLNAKFIIIIGEEELANNSLTIKNTKTKEQITIKEYMLLEYLKEKI